RLPPGPPERGDPGDLPHRWRRPSLAGRGDAPRGVLSDQHHRPRGDAAVRDGDRTLRQQRQAGAGMTALVLGVFLASLLGSLHCAGMCGAFLAIAVTGVGPGESRPRQFPLQAAYHLGRLATYTALGLAAGAAGRLLDLTSVLAGARPVAATLAGATLLAFGL